MLGWTSMFLALWHCYIYTNWTFAGYSLIVFSFVVAILAGTVSMMEGRKTDAKSPTR
jgi:hypothetical protein